MDAVLGLSMTPTTVGLVLVEGYDADGATMDHAEFPVRDRGPVGTVNTSEKATAAVLRTEAIAAARGHRLHSIGVTWSRDADSEASLLLESLSESGFDHVVAVRLPEATEALARGITSVIGYGITAVCVLEPDAVIVLVVDMVDGSVQTAITRALRTDRELARWLSGIFARTDWRPEALVLVGSGADLHAVTRPLEEVLAVPVFVPAEAQLALARGAALATARGADFVVNGGGAGAGLRPARRRPWPTTPVGAASAMLAVGVVTFVVSGSLAIGLRLTAGETARPAEQRPAVHSSELPAAESAPSLPAAPPRPVQAAPPPPPVAEVEPPPEVAPESVPAAESLLPEAPAPDALAPPDRIVPGAPPAPVPAGAPLPAGVTDPAPGIVPAPVTPVPEENPGLLQRLKDKLSGIGQPDEPPPPPAELAPPPPPP